MYHMRRMMQVGTSNCVPHMAHDAVKVLRTVSSATVYVKIVQFKCTNHDTRVPPCFYFQLDTTVTTCLQQI